MDNFNNFFDQLLNSFFGIALAFFSADTFFSIFDFFVQPIGAVIQQPYETFLAKFLHSLVFHT